MAIARSEEWLRSLRILLGTTALVDLVVRLPEDVFAPLVSITGGIFGGPLTSFITTWLMFAVAFYTFGPLAYSPLNILPRYETGFRAIFTAGAVAMGITQQMVHQASVSIALLLPGALVCGGLLLAYSVERLDWDITDPDGSVADILEFFIPGEVDIKSDIKTDLARGGWAGHLSLVPHLAAVALILGFPAFLAGFSIEVLITAFPVPDLLFLGWAVSARVLPQTSISVSRPQITALDFNFEEFLIDGIENATRNVQGTLSTVFIVTGLVTSSGYLFGAILFAPDVFELVWNGFVSLPSGLPFEHLLYIWDWIGVLTLLSFAGIHGLCVWIVEFYRLPHFLDVWEGQSVKDDVNLMTRVPGFVLISVVSWLLALAAITFDTPFVARIYAVLWPAVLALGGWTIYRTIQEPAQSVSRENIWIVLGTIIQGVAYLRGTDLMQITSALVGPEPLIPVLGLPVAIAACFLFVSTIPYVWKIVHYDDIRRYSMIGWLIVLGILAAGGSLLVTGRFQVLAYALSIAGWGGALLLSISWVYSRA